MNLPGIPFRKNNEPEVETVAFYYGLRIMPSNVQAVVWQQIGKGEPEIISWSGVWEWDSEDVNSLLTQIDQALGECSTALPDSVEEPDEVLLGLPISWVKDGKLLPDARDSLKHVTSNLGLKAMGFVVVSEAIINKLNGEGIGAVSGILIGIDGKQLDVTVALQGQVQSSFSQMVSTSDFTEEIIATLGALEADTLPPKIYLYNADHDLSHVQQTLQQYDWKREGTGFSHIPTIELLSSHIALEAVIFSIMGQQPIKETSIAVGGDSEVNELDNNDESGDELQKPIETDTVTTDNEENTLAELGFVKDTDIRKVTSKAYSWGGSDQLISENTSPQQPELEIQDEPLSTAEAVVINKTDKKQQSNKNNRRMPRPPAKVGRWIGIALVVLLVLVGGLVGGWWWVMSRSEAVVTLKFTPQLLEKEFEVTVLATEQEATDSAVLGATSLSIEGIQISTRVEGSKSVDTTGTKEVGERASGTVTIFNDTDTSRTLDAGTILTASNDLQFTLNEAVEIASKSVDLSSDSPFSPGKATAQVSAADIGADYNVAGQTAFRVANFSQSILLARNEEAFSGGSSREIQAVAEEDYENLKGLLEQSLHDQGLNQLKQQLNGSQELIDTSITTEWTSEDYSAEVGTEANTVELTGELKLNAVAYSAEELKGLVKEALVGEAAQDRQLAGDVQMSFELVSSENDVYVFSVVSKGYLAPTFTKDGIKEKIAGKSPEAVQGYLSSLPTVNEASYTISPRLPLGLVRYPKDHERITVTTELVGI